LVKSKMYMILFGVMFAWGMNVIATKILVMNFMPVTMTAFRIFTAAASVFLILGIAKKVRIPTKKEWLYIGMGSMFNVVGHHYFLSLGLKETSATNGGLILGTAPLLTAILSIIFLNHKVTRWKVAGILAGFFGISFVILGNGGRVHHISVGDVYVFLSILSQSISFIIISKSAKTLDPRLMTGYMLFIGSCALFLISIVLEPNGLQSMSKGTADIWAVFFLSAIVATACGHMMYNYAVGKLGAAESSIFINLNPFFALIGSFLFLGEHIALKQMLGFIFIILGVVFGSGAYEEIARRPLRKRKMFARQ
jgi:drug/metabolite transporter (DMT)-like permease